jgi:hypothetical protein
MLPLAIAEQLRHGGYDIAAAAERDDLRTKPDEVLFAVGQAESRAIVTENVADFRRIAAAHIRGNEQHSGIIFTTNDAFPRANPRTLGRVIKALEALLATDPDLTNREVWLSDWR